MRPLGILLSPCTNDLKSRRPSENALLPKLFVILKKIILGISTICLWLFFQAFLDFEQNCYSRTVPLTKSENRAKQNLMKRLYNRRLIDETMRVNYGFFLELLRGIQR